MQRSRIFFTWKTAFHSLSLPASLLLVLFLLMVSCARPPQPPPTPARSMEPTAPVPTRTDENTLHYAVFPAPPYMIGAGNDASAMSGIDVDIVTEIARRMQLKVEFIKCTWARCLELMKTGEADLLSSAYKKPDREAYLLFFSQPFLDRLPIAFYFLKGKNYAVTRYEDLYQFNSIGVLNEASYFTRFDQDTLLKKFEVSSQDQLFPMLMAGRLEAIAGYVPTENYRIATGGYRDLIERSAYEYQELAPVYLALSKKSPLATRFSEFNQINQQLIAEGLITRIVNAYYEKYR